MEEFQRQPDSLNEGKPRKVRFKLASSYSGRVLKHVYEDGQELDSPEEQYPHSFIHTKMEMGHLCGLEDMQDQSLYPPTGLIAQRINVYRGVMGCNSLACGDLPEGDNKAPVLDFGKIIIYTSNLKIIQAPHRRGKYGRSPHRSRDRKESSPGRESRSKGRHRSARSRTEEPDAMTEQKQEAGSCEQCGGSGCMPCSLCHGSKLSMLANRFNESIRELRCPACNPHGLQRCQSCTH
ncbi:glutaredoxin domain-containing cysteine-rich protein 2-like [Sinocyclocheilus anshuiensis]|uniref:glutaredoxin domain-containing cysteine-rich protein 2-like n=1 Tax=Sinocyclocheilus anshuiensis TaxID=1608454 RepID=UPI0007B90E2B|nr:PREDICTED: glutaredoxin domain-containing cysteine-rich protein 2-like [Sinocyclocheilus anshuiensis]